MSELHATEEWRPVPSIPWLLVSDFGRIKDAFSGHLLAFKASPSHGYVQIPINGRNYYAHCFVAEAFLGPRPHRMDVDHINRDKSDNRLVNLRYCSRSENTRNAARVGCKRIIPAADVPLIVSRVASGERQVAIAREYGVRHSTVSKALKRFRAGVPIKPK